MFPPDHPLASTARPMTRTRLFRVSIRCPYCQTHGIADVPMRGETRSRAGTSEDFFDAGGESLIENICAACGEEGIEITDVAYVPAPNEAPPLAMADL